MVKIMDTCTNAPHPLKETVSSLLRPSRVAFAGSVLLLFGGYPEAALVGLAVSFALAKRE